MEQERHKKKGKLYEFLENYYELSKNGTDVKTEIIAGMTTFLTMAYVLAVIPGFLREAGIPEGGLYTSVCLVAMLGTLMHALFSKLPVATAPGLGLTVFFVSTVVGRMGYTWQQGLAAVTISGVVLILVTVSSVRKIVLDGLPENIKTAITAGVGLFIALIGLKSSGIIVATETGLFLGSFKDNSVLLSVFGLLLMLVLMAKNVKGALIISIIATTLLGIPMGVTDLSKWHGFVLPGGVGDLFFKQDFEGLIGKKDIFSGLINMVMIVLTISMVDFFDKIGTLLAIASKGNLYNEKGEVRNMKRALLCESSTTVISSFFGATTTSTYLECTAGIAEGGRTGLAAFSTAVLFGVSFFLSGIVSIIPGAATSPALIVVGVLMLGVVTKINFHDLTEGAPAFFAITLMPFTMSVAEGVAGAVISYVVLKLATGRRKEIKPIMYILAILFVLKLALT
ncbi:putative permease [Leptotrichia sp. oral taxon 215 str. W9775]|uniref:NCS2 family permease n=1 Tax=Leptotrichia sp. oral taxon 215 TaxID=712359 RepID=UPI0003AE6268|nr:NCS2 family permease [Leptotrichia sp. oral taxon 215]ERK66922.1 putative permease [Leptotrichia sp. oral taxon 215 str. W9775]